MFEIRYDDRQLKELERTLAGIPRALPKVMSRALNRTATEARTKISRGLGSEMKGLRIKDIRDRIIIDKATYSNWRALVRIGKRRIPLLALKARQTRKGVTYFKGRNRVLISSAFIATMVGAKGGGAADLHTTASQRRGEWLQSGLTLSEVEGKSHTGVYMRKSSSRLPLVGLAGPSLAQVFTGAEDVANRIYAESLARLEKNIHDQVQLILRRRAG